MLILNIEMQLVDTLTYFYTFFQENDHAFIRAWDLSLILNV